jgi:hypothetical protein
MSESLLLSPHFLHELSRALDFAFVKAALKDFYVDWHSPDPEVRFGRKTPNKGFYGYKCHVVQDADSDFIV